MTGRLITTQKTSGEVVLYPHNLDAIALRPQGESDESVGQSPRRQEALARLTRVSTEKTMGAAGAWSATVKVPRSRVREWEESITDGDWADIIFQRDGRRIHVMRGIVEAVDPVRRVTNADTLEYVISGFDHQAVFEKTTIWFSTFSNENLFGGAALRASMITGQLFGLGGVRETVTGILYGFLQQLNQYGRALWKLPAQMPNGGGEAFATLCARLFDSRMDDPARIASGASLMSFENATLWQLANEWCEGQFNELWCDLAVSGARSAIDSELAATKFSLVAGARALNQFGAGAAPLVALQDLDITQSQQYENFVIQETDSRGPEGTQMAVFMRRRAFPTAEGPAGLENAGNINTGPWSQLATAFIRPEELVSTPLHRSSTERVNVIEVVPATVQEIAAASLSLLAPLVDSEDVQRRGVRSLSMRTRYHANIPKGVSDQALAESQRRMLRDWHCLNPRFYTGRLQLRTLRAGIRVGMIACVSANQARMHGDAAANDLTYYVEGVRNSWEAPGKGTTELTVTRGFRGGDEALYSALRKARVRFAHLQAVPSGPGTV